MNINLVKKTSLKCNVAYEKCSQRSFSFVRNKSMLISDYGSFVVWKIAEGTEVGVKHIREHIYFYFGGKVIIGNTVRVEIRRGNFSIKEFIITLKWKDLLYAYNWRQYWYCGLGVTTSIKYLGPLFGYVKHLAQDLYILNC